MRQAEATGSASVSRPILFGAAMIKSLLDGSKTQTRRPVVVARSITAIPRGHLTDLGRAWADRGFPSDESGRLVRHPAPESCYRNGYLHVPFAHPLDGWCDDPRADCLGRVYCPLGDAGDTLWVKETFALRGDVDPARERSKALHYILYRADHDGDLGMEWHSYGKWKPSIHLPKWASRITLRVVSVRPERLHAIADSDIAAEGVPLPGAGRDATVPRADFARMWDGIYKGRPGLGWGDDPWVWRVEFRRIEEHKTP